MALTEEDLPILKEVIRSGDAAIIRSTRLQQIDTITLDASSSDPVHFDLPAHLQFDTRTPQQLHPSQRYSQTSFDQTLPASPADDAAGDALESLIDDIVDKHIEALRKDLRLLLERARHLS
jgi:hypothetical protein